MGVPVDKLICASNSNNVLTDFINTGVYDRNRDFYTTISPSMDILISSNLERMLYILANGNSKYIADIQNELAINGKFVVNEDIKIKMQQHFYGGCCDDKATLQTIGDTFKDYGYLLDTHTAVAVNVYKQYLEETGDKRAVVIASTASPYKFAQDVLPAVSDAVCVDEFQTVRTLSNVTSTEIPAPIAALETASVRFKDIYDKTMQ